LRGLIQVCLQMRVHHTAYMQVGSEYQSMCIAYNKQAKLLIAEATSDNSSSSLQASGSSTSRCDKSSNKISTTTITCRRQPTSHTHQPSPDLQRVPEQTVSKLAQVRQAPDPKFTKHRQKKAVQTFTSTIVAVKS
jgi:hypothetical protein